MPEDAPSVSPPSFARSALDAFELGPGASTPIGPGGGSTIEEIVEFFEEETAARRAMQALERDEIIPRLKATLRERKDELLRQVASDLAWGLFITYTTRFSEAHAEEDWGPFENAQLAGEGKSPTEEALRDAGADTWAEDPPAPLQSIAEGLLQQDSWDTWAKRCAEPALQWAAWNFQQFHDPSQAEGTAGGDWEDHFREKIEAGELLEPVSLLSRAIAKAAVDRLNESAEGEGLSPLQIERLWGLHDEDDAPVPRPGNTAAASAEQDGFFPWASGGPASEGITAIRQAKHGWPEKDYDGRPKYPFTQKRPHHVTGHFMVVVPDSNQAPAAMEGEMAQRVLDEFGRHTTRLHLACAAYSVKGDPSKYTPIPRQYVYDMLGIKWDQRSDLSRGVRDLKAEKAIRNLRKLGVQIKVLDGPDGAPAELGLESVWGINVVKWGQKRAVGEDRILDHEDWQLMVRPNAWQQLYLNEESGARQFGYFSRKLIENIDWGNNPAAGDLAIELLKYVRFQDGGRPRDLKVETMLGICGLGQAKESWAQTRNRQKLERAILEQERWGWDVEWARWPDAYQPDKEDRPDFPNRWWQGNKRDDWESSFHDWKVIFSPPEDLAEMNSRAQEIDSSDPHELEPKGWPDRIKAIINETGYTQADLSRILEVSRAAVSQWKNGNRTPGGPHRAKLRDIERRGGLR